MGSHLLSVQVGLPSLIVFANFYCSVVCCCEIQFLFSFVIDPSSVKVTQAEIQCPFLTARKVSSSRKIKSASKISSSAALVGEPFWSAIKTARKMSYKYFISTFNLAKVEVLVKVVMLEVVVVVIQWIRNLYSVLCAVYITPTKL